MLDLWILAFIARGAVAAAGDVMPLDECQWRGRDMQGPWAEHVVCINAQRPQCRVYLQDSPAAREQTGWCLKRAQQGKGSTP